MTKHDTSRGKCCPDAVANALIDMYREMQKNINDEEDIATQAKKMTPKTSSNKKNIKTKNPCPVCGEELIFEGGCNVCKSCGWSKCD